MREIVVNASKKYKVLIKRGIIENAGEKITEIFSPCKVAIITDDLVNEIYSQSLENSLNTAGFSICKFVFKNGEESKNLSVFGNALEFLAENSLTKSDIIIALGGGVAGDLAGFVASVYLRGIPFVQIPTTLLAAVDSSVGGKTAVNLNAGKNLAGTFYQPSMVLCDCDTFSTLQENVFADGVAEAIKYGVISDLSLFNKFLNGESSNSIEDVVDACIRIKSKIVEQDEFDNGARQLLNFGHTIGHAIEKCSNFSISHGHAVAIGMAVVAKAAWEKGLSKENLYPLICRTLEKNKLPTKCPYTAQQLFQSAVMDKKRRGEDITLIIPVKIGECILHKMPVQNLLSFIESGLA